jgi:Cytochrome c554 and c-prime
MTAACRGRSHTRTLVGAFFSVGGILCLLAAWSFGKAPGAQAQSAKPDKGPTPRYYGVAACTACHAAKTPDEVRQFRPLLCRCNEALIWKEKDKHKDAYTMLLADRGRRIAKSMGIADVSKDMRCISCHAQYIPPDKYKQLADVETYKIEDGVSCVACHGAYEEWVGAHYSTIGAKRNEWRGLSREDKEKRFGMTDLWDPGKRAQKCASCHVGSAQEGKVVTHEMFAAGHPPLPGLEVATFSDDMPRHWQYLKEKLKEKTSADDRELLTRYYHQPDCERTSLALHAGSVALQEAMSLLAAQAERCAKAQDVEHQTLDLARFDCYACHHELKIPSWRQARGYAGSPGRPQFRPWPLALVRLGLRHVSRTQGDQEWNELKQELTQLTSAFDAQPFGDPALVYAAAGRLADASKKLTEKLSQAKYDQPAARHLLRELCALAVSETPDYDSARQMAWAFGVIYSDLEPQPANDLEIQKQVAVLKQALKLDLPSGQNRKIEDALPESLRAINDYDPAVFRHTFLALSKLIPQN